LPPILYAAVPVVAAIATLRPRSVNLDRMNSVTELLPQPAGPVRITLEPASTSAIARCCSVLQEGKCSDNGRGNGDVGVGDEEENGSGDDAGNDTEPEAEADADADVHEERESKSLQNSKLGIDCDCENIFYGFYGM
jgi:hypothetical protein